MSAKAEPGRAIQHEHLKVSSAAINITVKAEGGKIRLLRIHYKRTSGANTTAVQIFRRMKGQPSSENFLYKSFSISSNQVNEDIETDFGQDEEFEVVAAGADSHELYVIYSN